MRTICVGLRKFDWSWGICHAMKIGHQLVTKQDPMGPTQDRSLLHILCFSSSRNLLDDCAYTHFLSCFTDAKIPTKGKRLTTWRPWPHGPRPTCAYRWITFTSMTPPCYLTINQSENSADHMPLPYVTFKNAFLEPMGSSGVLSTSYQDSLLGSLQ